MYNMNAAGIDSTPANTLFACRQIKLQQLYVYAANTSMHQTERHCFGSRLYFTFANSKECCQVQQQFNRNNQRVSAWPCLRERVDAQQLPLTASPIIALCDTSVHIDPDKHLL